MKNRSTAMFVGPTADRQRGAWRAEVRRMRVTTGVMARRSDEAVFAAQWAAQLGSAAHHTAQVAAQRAQHALDKGVRGLVKGLVTANVSRVRALGTRAISIGRGLVEPRPAAPPPPPVVRPSRTVHATPGWPVGSTVDRRWGTPTIWGDPLMAVVLVEGRWSKDGRARILEGVRRQSIGSLEVVEVSARGDAAWTLGADGRPNERWELDDDQRLTDTLWSKYVCLAELSMVALPPRYLELNAFVLEGHDVDFAVNAFAPRPLVESAVLDRCMPDTQPGQADRPLVVFRSELLDRDRFSLAALTRELPFRTRPVGRVLVHESIASAPFTSPAQWPRTEGLPGAEFGMAEGELSMRSAGGDPVIRGRLLRAEGLVKVERAAKARGRSKPRVMVCLPFAAIGGAERLTFDVLDRLTKQFEFVGLTVERADASVGSSEQEMRALCRGGFYSAADLVDARLVTSLACHLLQANKIETLFVPNGSNWFYEAISEVKAKHPELRVVNQVFDHHYGWIGRYSPEIVRQVDMHVAPNGAIATAYQRAGVASDRIARINHGIDLEDFDPSQFDDQSRAAIRAKLGLDAGKRVVCFVARLHPQKRPWDFVRVAAALREQKDVTFLMVGDGAEWASVGAMIETLELKNLKRVSFYQPVKEVLAVSDVLVLPSEYEGLPLVVLNALAMGVPVVATRVGSIGEVLTNELGVLVEKAGDIKALVAGVQAVLGRDDRAFVKKARERLAADFEIGQVATAYGDALVAANP